MFTIYADGDLIYQPGDQELLVLQPKLTLEMGSSGSLDFEVPPTNPYYNSLKQLTTVITANLDGVEIFRGRILSNSRNFRNIRQTYCEGCLSYLVDSVQKGEKYEGTAHQLFRQIISKHNALVNAEKQFTVGNITVPDKDIKIAGKSSGNEEDPDAYTADYWRQIYIDSVVDNWSTTWDYLNQCLIDYQGGYLMVRRVSGTNYIDWVKDYNTTSSQPIEFGSNLLDLTEEISADQLFTVLIPIGDDNLTIASVNGGSIELVDSTAVAKYGRIVKTEVFSNVNSAATLLENGRAYLQNEANVPTTFTIKAVDLSMIDNSVAAIRVGNRVQIVSTPHNISQYYTCTKIEYDLEDPSNTVFTFGNPRQTLTQRYRRDKRVEKETSERNSVTASSVQQETADDIMHFHIAGELEELENKITDSTTGDTAKKLEEFWDAWINTSPSQGNIDLGAVYKRLEDTVLVLQNNAGLNIDAPSGTVNIFTTSTVANSAASTANSADAKADDAQTKTAQIILWAGTDEHGNLGSNIALNADVVAVSNRLTAIEGIFDSITANRIYASRSIASGTSFYAPSFIVADTTGGSNEVDLANHKHSLFCDSNGNVTMGLPVPPNVAVGFNIAETQFFQDAVSAAGAASVKTIVANRETTDGNIVWNATNKTLGADYTLVAKDKDNNTLYSEFEYPITLPATKAFNAGQTFGAETVEVTGATVIIDNTHLVDSGHHYIVATVTPSARATKADGSYATANKALSDRRISADAVYEAGSDSVTIPLSGITVTKQGTYGTDQDGKQYVTIKASATASNDASNERTITVYVDDVYAAGANSKPDVASIIASRETSDSNLVWNSTNKTISGDFTLTAKDANGNVIFSAQEYPITLPANKAYDAGQNYGATTVQVTGVTATVTNTHLEENGHHYVVTTLSPSARALRADGYYAVSQQNYTDRKITADAVFAAGAASNPSVATIVASRETSDSQIVWNGTDKTLTADFNLIAKDSEGNVIFTEEEYPITMPANKAFMAVSATGIAVVLDSIEHLTYPNGNHYARVPCNVYLTNGKTVGPMNINVPTQVEYQEGLDAGQTENVEIDTVTGVAYAASGDHQANILYENTRYYNGYLYGLLNVTLTNGSVETIYVGVDAGKAEGSPSISTITSIAYTSSSASDYTVYISAANGYYNKNYGDYIWGRAKITFSDNSTKIILLRVDASKASNVNISTIASTTYSETTDYTVSVQDEDIEYYSNTLHGTLQITLSNGTTKTVKVGLDATKAGGSSGGSAEVAHITATQVTADSQIVWNAANKTLAADYKLMAKDANGNTLGVEDEYPITIDASKAFNAVGITSFDYVTSVPSGQSVSNYTTSYEPSVTYNASDKTISIFFKGTLSNGVVKYYKETFPGTKPYNAGWDYGAETVEVTGAQAIISNTHLVENDHHYVVATITPTARAKKSSGEYTTANAVLTDRKITADAVYDAGYRAGAASGSSSVVSITASRETTDGNVVWNSSNKTVSADFSLYARGSNSNIIYAEREYPIAIPATKAYNAGQDYGASTVDITGATTSITNTHLVESGHHYVVTTITPSARATKADGTYATTSEALTNRKITADAVYNKGYLDGQTAIEAVTSSRETSDSNVVWNASNQTVSADFSLFVRANGNNIFVEREHTISIPAAKAYNAGYAAAQQSGSGTTVDHVNLTVTYNSSAHNYSVVATVYGPNNTLITSRSTASNTDAYDWGYDAGYSYASQEAIGVSNVGYETDENGSTDWNYIWVRLTNGTTKGNIRITPNGYTTGYNAGYRAASGSSSSAYNDGYNAGYNAGHDAGYSEGYRQGIIDINRVTSITVTATNSNAAGIRAYHSDGGYGFRWVSIGDYWNGY